MAKVADKTDELIAFAGLGLARSTQYEQVLRLPSSRSDSRFTSKSKRVHAADGIGGGIEFDDEDDFSDSPVTSNGPGESDAAAPPSKSRDVAAASAQGQSSSSNRGTGRKPPRGGHHFKRDDSVKSKKPPPGDCRVCGSPYHWDRDCPHWNKYDIGRNALLIGAEYDCDEQENVDYEQAFVAYICNGLNNTKLSSALWMDLRQAEGLYLKNMTTSRPSSNAVTIEEEEETSIPNYETLPPDHPRIMEAVESDLSEATEKLTDLIAEALTVDGSCHAFTTREALSGTSTIESGTAAPIGPGPGLANNPKVVTLNRVRDPPAGHSTVGVSALSFQLRFGSPSHSPVQCRADSGADISLVSQEYLDSLPSTTHPKIRQGLHMNLFQLTGGFRITGYVQTQVYVKSEQGHTLKMMAECYVVPGMSSPLLLGEDFHVNYELGVTRSLEEGSAIQVGDTGYSIPASSAIPDHYREQTKKLRPTAIATQDVRISPHSCRLVPVQASFLEHDSWFIEKTVLGQSDGSFLLTTPSIIDAEHVYVSVTNPTDRPIIVCKGESLGLLHDPSQH
ncbi:uncharacterized protein B0H18DRAFT_882563, partial [Fomitopsis serialis]|uniref:uncharacterized protein n=1 Tax=Fomitopsis serialis TaxID=139415 RepID=UPI002008595D